MTLTTFNQRWPLVLTAAALIGLAIGLVGPTATSQAATAQQTSCDWDWDSAGRAATELFHTASAMDTDKHHLYIYGGVDGSFAPQNTVERGDFSGQDASATNSRISAGGALNRIGAAGAYRAKGADSDDSAVYFVGGLGDPQGGQADGDIQKYATKAGSWSKTSATVSDRFFATATYVPEQDAIWVIGGVTQCALPDVLGGATCQARSLATQYITFDDMTGEPVVNTLSGANVSNFAHSAVYDSTAKRILVFGGTNDISRGNSDLVALDVSDPDPSKAKFTTVASSGRAPRVFFHSAAFDPGRNMMIVNGGVSQGFLASNESTENKTYGLDLAATTPTWMDMGTSLQDRVAGVMEWDANHGVAIYTLGRKKYNGNPMQPQNVVRTSHGLICTEVQPTATPGPTNTPAPTRTPGGPGGSTDPWMPPSPEFESCPQLQGRVPDAAVQAALGNPPSSPMLCNPNVPIGPTNLYRDKLSLQDNNKPYHPIFNRLQWKCGCQ